MLHINVLKLMPEIIVCNTIYIETNFMFSKIYQIIILLLCDGCLWLKFRKENWLVLGKSKITSSRIAKNIYK